MRIRIPGALATFQLYLLLKIKFSLHLQLHTGIFQEEKRAKHKCDFNILSVISQ